SHLPALALPGRERVPALEVLGAEPEASPPACSLGSRPLRQRARTLGWALHVLHAQDDARRRRLPPYAARVGLQLAAQQAQQGRLARSVLAHEPVPARGEVQGHALEQRRGPIMGETQIDDSTRGHRNTLQRKKV